ncbi:MAG: outer membrane beta-barrel protein, partial [Opitutae bacterium]|nr:outer membrane beta-barrel protein [Opitutae bacterium]
MLLPLQASHALLNIDGTRNQVFVFGHVAFGFSSNIFSSNGGAGDYSVNASVGAELKRRAGIISVNSTFTLDYVQYAKLTDQSSWNPRFALELNKTIGRTTGAFTLNAFRESRADTAVNTRTTSWNFPLGLNIKYPVSDRFYATSSTGYLSRRYGSGSNLINLADYSEGLDAFYVFTSKLDLLGGFRIRVSKTSNNGQTVDNAFTLGATGGLLPKINGTVRFGYQFRKVDATRENFSQITASASATWIATRKFNVTGTLSRDFSTTATAQSVDALGASARATYVFTRRFEVDGGVGYGRNIFLGNSFPFRRDDNFSWDVGARFSFNEHLRIGLNYNYYRNWSTASFS